MRWRNIRSAPNRVNRILYRILGFSAPLSAKAFTEPFLYPRGYELTYIAVKFCYFLNKTGGDEMIFI